MNRTTNWCSPSLAPRRMTQPIWAGWSLRRRAAGTAVRVSDVAEVQPGVLPVFTAVTAEGKPAVLVNITRQPASNTVAVADAVSAQVERLKKNLPAGVELKPYYDQSELVRESIRSVRDAILIGLGVGLHHPVSISP